MECMTGQPNYLDLKFEDNGDYYLINSFLGLNKNDEDAFIDDVIQDRPLPLLPQKNTNNIEFGEQIVREAAAYVCFRTTSLREIMSYLEQYYRIPQEKRKEVLSAARRLKLKLKRTHARLRNTDGQIKSRQEIPQADPLQIKIEESELSPFVFDEESQETRKKKRNRMSAQNSRDRKKEYIRQIQNQNRELKRRLAAAERPHKMPASSKDFIKMILCLGITCYTNLNSNPAHHHTPCQGPAEDITADERNEMLIEADEATPLNPQLPIEIKLLNPLQQGLIAQLMENLCQSKQGRGRMQTHFECTDLISEVASQKSTSSEGGRKSRKSQYI